MRIEKVKAVYFSPTGNTDKAVNAVAETIGEKLSVPVEIIDFTLPCRRNTENVFDSKDLVVFGSPVYAGRIPNKILPYIQASFDGNGALAVAVSVYGNRNFDDALTELCHELEAHGFHTIAAAAVTSSHVFSDKIAPGRPDNEDITEIREFAENVAEKIMAAEEIPQPVKVPGNDPVGAYYTPLGEDGSPAKFLKAKPVTDTELCGKCGICADVCPMGSIDKNDSSIVNGICIKCQACIKKCPVKAKYFDDEAFLSHVKMLENNYTERKENRFFIGI